MRFACLVICVISLAGLSACNTMQGLGKDVEKAGEAISGAAKK